MKGFLDQYGTVTKAWYPLGGRGNTETYLTDETVNDIAKAHGKSVAQMILRWHLQDGHIAIPGSHTPDHIKENTELFDFELSDEEIDRLLVLDVKDQSYFDERGINDQHAGGMAFAHEETMMGWLFGQHNAGGEVSVTGLCDFPAELEEIPSGYYFACDESGTVE